MHVGQKIIVEEAFSGQQVKMVVAWNNSMVYVCREEEYIKAKRENREPASTGFPMQFVKMANT